jgi:hypothetical protein
MNRKVLLYGGQVLGSVLILALPVANLIKLALFLMFWAVTFGRLTRREWVAAVLVYIGFTALDLGTVHQSGFYFVHPDFGGIAAYAPLIYVFLFLHTMRVLSGPIPQTRPPWLAWAMALLFCGPFLMTAQTDRLFWITGAILGVALVCFHEKFDVLYTLYLIILGTLIEHTAVASGQWGYPQTPWGGVPLWSITMWGGIGLFVRRLLYPLVYG